MADVKIGLNSAFIPPFCQQVLVRRRVALFSVDGMCLFFVHQENVIIV
jgi:hypothetical protein